MLAKFANRKQREGETKGEESEGMGVGGEDGRERERKINTDKR